MRNNIHNEEVQLHYEVEPKYIPQILEIDWGIKLREDEEEIAIRLFQWHFGMNADDEVGKENVEFDDWSMQTSVPYSKGYFKGKLSFSLSTKDIDVIAVLIKVVSYFYTLKEKTSVDRNISGIGLLYDILKNVVKIKILENNFERCLFILIIEKSQNNSHIPVNIKDIKDTYCDFLNKDYGSEPKCLFIDSFRCSHYSNTECSCLLKKDDIEKLVNNTIKEFEKKGLVQKKSDENFLYIT